MSGRSGNKGMLINTGERAVSTDINRLQALQAGATMELFRWLLDVGQGTDDVGAGSLASEHTSQTSPETGEILGGLCVLPELGTFALNVSGGLALMVDPDAVPSADDSPYKYVRSLGGTSATVLGGPLVLTANPLGSGGTRIDVIECSRVDDPANETDNRDIFDPTTNLFAATTVTKSVASTLTFRVRPGTPGGGFPGTEAGWMPLAIASVPAGTTSVSTPAANDNVTFWDVRPLVNDRANGVGSLGQSVPRRTKLTWSQLTGNAGSAPANGIVEATYQGRRLGGQLRRGSPGVDYAQPYIDFMDAANCEKNFTFAASGMVFYYLLVPYGLPRWARYTDYPSGSRLPRSPRGIPLLSKVHPQHVTGLPQAGIVLPAAFGLGSVAVTDAVCFGATTMFLSNLVGHVTSDGWTNPSVPTPYVTQTGPSDASFLFQENVHVPAGATKIRVQMNLQCAFTSGGTASVTPFNPEFTTTLSGYSTYQMAKSQTNTVEVFYTGTDYGTYLTYWMQWVFEVELPNLYPVAPSPADPYYKCAFTMSSTPDHGTLSVPTGTIIGWKME